MVSMEDASGLTPAVRHIPDHRVRVQSRAVGVVPGRGKVRCRPDWQQKPGSRGRCTYHPAHRCRQRTHLPGRVRQHQYLPMGGGTCRRSGRDAQSRSVLCLALGHGQQHPGKRDYRVRSALGKGGNEVAMLRVVRSSLKRIGTSS